MGGQGGAGKAGHLYFSVYLGGEGGDSVGGKVCVVFPLCCGAQEVCQWLTKTKHTISQPNSIAEQHTTDLFIHPIKTWLFRAINITSWTWRGIHLLSRSQGSRGSGMTRCFLRAVISLTKWLEALATKLLHSNSTLLASLIFWSDRRKRGWDISWLLQAERSIMISHILQSQLNEKQGPRPRLA